MNPDMLTAREAYELIQQPSPLPGGTYSFCYDVLDLWGAKPVDSNSSANLVFMLSSVFAVHSGISHQSFLHQHPHGL